MSTELFLVAPASAEAESFAGELARLLDAEPAAALFLPRGDRDDESYRAFVSAILPIAQPHDCAVLVDNDAALAKELGADGVHITLGITAVRNAIELLKPDMIVGVGALHSHHDAMMKAEAGADYVFFGDLEAGAALPEDIDTARWWAETFEVPCVLFEAGRDAAGTGAEFAALGPSVFSGTAPVTMRRALAGVMLALALCSLAQAQETTAPTTTVLNTSPSGPVRPTDDAYGAFQRGYYLTALSLALDRAAKDDAAAQTLIAEIYANGLGVPESAAKAASWYALADKNGDANASFALAMMYQNGTGVPTNHDKAAALMERAAAGGLPSAQYNLALLYVQGTHVPPNQQKAAELMAKAADAGLAEAERDYGLMLMQGAGTAPDPRLGASYVRAAAEAGLVDAMVEYATLRYLGRGVDKDIENAASWYQRAANLGNPVAQNRLAILLAAGEGVPKNLEMAAMWRALARRAGLNDPQTDELLKDISPETLAKGEERARIWPDVPESERTPSTTPTQTITIAPDGSMTMSPMEPAADAASEIAPAADGSAAPAGGAPQPADPLPRATTGG